MRDHTKMNQIINKKFANIIKSTTNNKRLPKKLLNFPDNEYSFHNNINEISGEKYFIVSRAKERIT